MFRTCLDQANETNYRVTCDNSVVRPRFSAWNKFEFHSYHSNGLTVLTLTPIIRFAWLERHLVLNSAATETFFSDLVTD